ncbi:MAG: GIY-YIG nuclease family protein [Ignavibacteriae bacterium]|nr:GIY-YIG nuclease family protein [Ignavibacteriota bacterium]
MHYYVYLLKSINYSVQSCFGFTKDLRKRLEKNDECESKYTSKYKPWELQTTESFLDKKKSTDFEKYLKSHSGRAFTKEHF